MRKLIIIISLISIGLLFFNGGEKEKKPSDEEIAEKKVIKFWRMSSPQHLMDIIQELAIDEYNKTHPGVEIVFEYFGDYDRVLQTSMGAGTGPDFMHLHGPSYAIEFYDAGMVIPLEDYAKQYGWDKKIFQWALDASTYKGHLISIPYHYETMVLYYNKTIFEKNGWKIPKNWDEFVGLCEAIEKKGLIPMAYGSADFIPANTWMTSVFFSYVSGPDKIKQLFSGKTEWTDPAFKEAIEKYTFLWQRGWYSDKKSQSLTMADAWGLWQAQRAVMKIEGTWAFESVDEYSTGFEWDWAPLPKFGNPEPPVTIGIGQSFAVNAKSQHIQETIEYIDWLFSDPKRVGKIIAAAKGDYWLPITLQKDDFPPELDSRITKTFSWISEGVAKGHVGYCTWTFWPPKTDAFQATNLDSVVLNKMSIDYYLEESQELFKEELEEGKVPPLP